MRKFFALIIIGLALSALPAHAEMIGDGGGGGGGGSGGGGGGGGGSGGSSSGSACTPSLPNCPGYSCPNLGQTQMSADKANIIACLESNPPSDTSYVWKAMSSSSTVSLTDPGYIILSEGLMIEWGQVTLNDGCCAAFTSFPKTFHEVLSVTATTYQGTDRITYIPYWTTSGIQIQNNGSGASASWIAIGY